MVPMTTPRTPPVPLRPGPYSSAAGAWLVAARFLALALLAVPSVLRGDYSVDITIDPSAGRAPISRYVYGSNQDIPGAPFTARRIGGNRLTGYNWENNASNAGNDWYHSSDNFLPWSAGIPDHQASTPGIVLTHFHDRSIAAGVPYSIVTLPMAGYVAADKNGPVETGQIAPSFRWVPVVHTKPSAFDFPPSLMDGAVYSDELLAFLVGRYGDARSATGIRGYNLDNEPDLWASTHARLHPARAGCAELVSRSVDLARVIKRVDPTAETLGFVSYGFNGYYSLQDAPDWPGERAKGGGRYRWFVDYYLDEMKKASDAAGQRLLDVLDVHNYSEHIAGGERVTEPSSWGNAACNLGRLQAPRSFWDPAYVENSWIGTWFRDYLPWIPNLMASIDTFYPGTKLAFTEYNCGGEGHISGGLAQADLLGIFGRDGVYLATFWQLHEDASYVAAAFRLYRDYDGAGARFGDTRVAVTRAGPVDCAAFGSVDAADAGKLHLILLNKNAAEAAQVRLQFAGPRQWVRGRVFGFDAASAALTERAAISAISGNTVVHAVPALTALHLVFEAAGEPPAIVLHPRPTAADRGARVCLSVLATGTAPLAYRWQKDGADVRGADGAALTIPAIGAGDAGSYRVIVRNDAGSATSAEATVSVSGVDYMAPATRLVNLSTRGFVGGGGNVMIAGFTIAGSGAKQVLVRAAGPTIGAAPHFVPGVLADPKLTLTTQQTGALLARSDNWDEEGDRAALAAAFARTGAFPLVPGARESALLVTLPAGTYTAIVEGADGGSGEAIVEVYDADPDSAARLVNLSTRGQASGSDQVMIMGFVVEGAGVMPLLLRGVGPRLGEDPFNVPGVLPDPLLELTTQSGSLLARNDNWSTLPGDAMLLSQTFGATYAFGLATGSRDAAMVHASGPGGYTAILSGTGAGAGVVLGEIYVVP